MGFSLNIFLNKVQILDNLYNQVFQYIKQNLLFDLFSLKKGLEILSGLREEIKMTKVLFSKYMTNEEDEYLNYLSREYKIVWDDIKIYYPFEIGDQSAIIENQRVAKIKFRNLSSQYKESLLFMVEQIVDKVSLNELKKIMKNIEKGA